MTQKQVRELISDALAELSAAGLPFFFFARCDDGVATMVSPGLASLCKTPIPTPAEPQPADSLLLPGR